MLRLTVCFLITVFTFIVIASLDRVVRSRLRR